MLETPRAEVRHERRDAHIGLVLLVGGLLVVGAIAAHLVLYPLLRGMESRQRTANGSRSPQLPEDVRQHRPHFPEQLEAIRAKHHGAPLQVADYRDMEALRKRENDQLKRIEAAFKLIEDPAKAKAHGIIARELKEAK